MDHDELRRAARVSGITAPDLPSPEQVERDGVDPATHLQQADRALYAAKAAGRGTWRTHQPDLVGTLPRSAGATTGLPAPRAGAPAEVAR